MKILSANLSFKKSNLEYTYTFNKNDINHNVRIYKKYDIIPETIDKVSISFLLQRDNFIRYIIKELDILLKPTGIFEILLINSKSHCTYFRSRDQIKYEFSLATDGRYKLIEVIYEGKYLKLKYFKTKQTLLEMDTVDKWTFGIITNGTKLNFINNLINSIYRQNIPNMEIIICGPYPLDQQIDYSKIIILDDIILKDDKRFPISSKKNKIIKKATYQNICLLHDRFYLPDTWFDQIKKYGNYFDYLCMPTVDFENKRYPVDWMIFCFPLTKRLHHNYSLDYNEWSADLIIQGGLIIGKKFLLERQKLDERLHWEEMEDLHFSKLAYLDGSFFYIDKSNHVFSESVNHNSNSGSGILFKIKNRLIWLISTFKALILYNYYINKYKK